MVQLLKSVFSSLSGWTLGLAVFIILSASFMRQLLELILTQLTRQQISMFIYAALSAMIALSVFIIIRQRSLVRILLSLLPLGCMALLAIIMPMPEERVHIVKYGLLGYLACADLFKVSYPAVKSFFLTLLVGCCVALLDEGFQVLLPYRVGDLRDVAFDCLSCMAGSLVYIIAYGNMAFSVKNVPMS